MNKWEQARARLKKVYKKKGITCCEVNLEGCLHCNFLSFHHRHKRVYYYNHPGLGSFKETILVCQSCHEKLESNKQLSEEFFKKLRG